METRYKRIKFKNSNDLTTETEEHRSIIEEYAKDGYKYAGYFPVKTSSNGKILIVDLIFQK